MIHSGGSLNGSTPKWMLYTENPMKMVDLGIPLFYETSIYRSVYNLNIAETAWSAQRFAEVAIREKRDMLRELVGLPKRSEPKHVSSML